MMRAMPDDNSGKWSAPPTHFLQRDFPMMKRVIRASAITPKQTILDLDFPFFARNTRLRPRRAASCIESFHIRLPKCEAIESAI